MHPLAVNVAVVISCDHEWRAVLPLFPGVTPQRSPVGEWLEADLALTNRRERAVVFHGGWGKISAAASAQYIIDRWSPTLLLNLGTCGGFRGDVERGEILLVERTAAYDILEQMTDPEAAIARYTTHLDLSWLPDPPPQAVRRAAIVSADRDLCPGDIPELKTRYRAVAADWESASIAWVAARNGVRCVILRGVSDLVGNGCGDAYDGNFAHYVDGAAAVMRKLIQNLPAWAAAALPKSGIPTAASME